jgi:hypothetical protein
MATAAASPAPRAQSQLKKEVQHASS